MTTKVAVVNSTSLIHSFIPWTLPIRIHMDFACIPIISIVHSNIPLSSRPLHFSFSPARLSSFRLRVELRGRVTNNHDVC